MNPNAYKTNIINQMDKMKNKLQKQMDDMDLENLDVKTQMQDEVDGMIKDINTSIARINHYNFK